LKKSRVSAIFGDFYLKIAIFMKKSRGLCPGRPRGKKTRGFFC